MIESNMSNRDYKMTRETVSYGEVLKVEIWNDYGMKRTIYEEDVIQASEMIMNWWRNSDVEYKKMKSLSVVLNNMVKKK